MKKVKVEFIEDNVQILVELLEDEAPKTCEEIWNRLPFEGNLLHDIWSGPQVFLPLEMIDSIYPENLTMFVHPGDVFFFSRESGEFRGKPYGLDSMSEIGIVYDRDAAPRGPAGQKSVNSCGRVVGGLSDLKKLCSSMIFNGPKKVRVTRYEEAN